jgi:hypothetical protein
MHTNTRAIRQRLHAFDFAELFTQELGWDWYEAEWPVVEADDRRFLLKGVAEKRGLVVVHCVPEDGGDLPDYALRKKIETQVTRRAFEHLLIHTDGARTRQVWQFARREHGQSVKVRELLWQKGQSGDDLVQRLAALAISLDDEDTLTLPDVVRLTQAQLDVERVTKRFYQLFDRQKHAFTKAIAGISAGSDREWYASVMLNRLMFIYFVQKKGFLDGNRDYLRTKLAECQLRLGQDQFHNFYRSFLLVLFQDGLNKRPEEHTAAFKALAGNVPYLNGGIFDLHRIEETYGDAIDIPDEAFEKIFDFFDGYRWHLDDRPIVEGNEINPDVLGYIFEKYINQKQMGAYYTKEDITGYISKNTLIPHLFDRVQRSAGVPPAIKHGGAGVPPAPLQNSGQDARSPVGGQDARAPLSPLAYAFDLLREDPDRYIYDAIKHGWAVDIHQKDANGRPAKLDRPRDLPADIAAGLVDLDQPDLVERRQCWNRPAPPEVALPTEIWREVVHRRQRYFSLRDKLARGEVRAINDLITLNLDITTFARDALDRCPDKHTLAAFWKALVEMTVLDPTCGSGAFLFAALEILEPLYDAALNRMDGLLHDMEGRREKLHPGSHEARFRDILADVASHPNRTYFVLKTIIVHNLYGVDIMEEAVEICKLRLFLKLAAQVDPDPARKNFGIEPLPDIDFNIKAGNTLVGFATESEVRRVLTQSGDQLKLLMDDDLFGYERVEEKLRSMDALYKTFCASQLEGDDEGRAQVKARLRRELRDVTAVLDDALAREYGVKPEKTAKFDAWKASHQPFHWFCEFFGIMKNGGFDVIIGNPPYVVYPSKSVEYSFLAGQYTHEACKNLYGLTIERSAYHLGSIHCSIGLIVQLTVMSSGKFQGIQNLVQARGPSFWIPFPRRPESLFEGVEMPTAIVLSRGIDKPKTQTENVLRFYSDERENILRVFKFNETIYHSSGHRVAKIGSQVEASIFLKVFKNTNPLVSLVSENSPHQVFYQEACRYWIKSSVGLPRFIRNGVSQPPAHGRVFCSTSEANAAFISSLLNSSLFYWAYSVLSDCEHVNDSLVKDWPVSENFHQEDWTSLYSRLATDLQQNARQKTISTKQGHTISYDEINASLSKPIIDEIDKVLAKHYGFTPEELDFIINYDIKYRMGLGKGSGEEDE